MYCGEHGVEWKQKLYTVKMGKVFEVIYMNKSIFFFTLMYHMIRYFGQKQ